MKYKPYIAAVLGKPEWRRSRSGNRFLICNGNPITVCETKSRQWCFVYDGEWSDEYATEEDATDEAERFWRIQRGIV